MSGDILSAHFRMVFEDSLSPSQQQQAVDALKDYISELKHGTDEQRRELGIFDDEDTVADNEAATRKLHAALEKCYWQLVMFLRFSRPSRILEAVPYLRILLSHMHTHVRHYQGYSTLHEIHTMLYLAAALAAPPLPPRTQGVAPPPIANLSVPVTHLSPYSASTTPGSSLPCSPPPELAHEYPSRDAEALALFTRAFVLYDSPSPLVSPQVTPRIPSTYPPALSISPNHSGTHSPVSHPVTYAHVPGGVSPHAAMHHRRVLGPKTELWARGSYANLMRRLGREQDAIRVIDCIRTYIMHHPYALPSEKYHKLLKDIETEFGLTLLDATLTLETDTALKGEEREIEHVEDAGVDEDDADKSSEDEGEDISTDDDVLAVLSPVLSISPSSSSDSGSSAESSVASSPITPSASHFPPHLLSSEHHRHVAIGIETYKHDVVGSVARDAGRLSLQPPLGKKRTAAEQLGVVEQPELDADSDDSVSHPGAYTVVGYGAI